MIGVVSSNNNIPIRLTEERWFHIVENHRELAGLAFEILETVKNPHFICAGPQKELLAIKKFKGHYLIAVYRESVGSKDGFVITAFLTSKVEQIKKKGILWQKHSKKQ